MRMTPAQKTAARAAIVAAAGRRFREAGLSGIGIDALASASGQSSGAIYAHFASKTEVFEAVIAGGLERLIKAIRQIESAAAADPRGWAAVFAERYLSAAHRDAVADSCLLPSLGVDVARSSEATRVMYAKALDEIAVLLSGGCVGPEQGRLGTARALLALVVGAIVLSRAALGGARDDMLADARLAASRLLEP